MVDADLMVFGLHKGVVNLRLVAANSYVSSAGSEAVPSGVPRRLEAAESGEAPAGSWASSVALHKGKTRSTEVASQAVQNRSKRDSEELLKPRLRDRSEVSMAAAAELRRHNLAALGRDLLVFL